MSDQSRLRSCSATSRQADRPRQGIRPGQLLEGERDALRQDLGCGGQGPASHGALLGGEVPLGMRDFETLRLVEVHCEIRRKSLGERTPAQREHPGRLDAAPADDGDIGGSAPEVHEDRAQLMRLR